MAKTAERLHEQFVRSGRFPTPEQFAIQVTQGDQPEATQNEFWNRYDQYLEFLENKGVGERFRNAQRATGEIFKLFERQTRTPIDFGEIGRTTAAKFTNWLALQPRKTNRQNQRIEKTAAYHIRKLKHFLNLAMIEGWTNSMAHKQIKLDLRREEEFPTTLTKEEVLLINRLTAEQIAAHMPRKNKTFLRGIIITRDWFVFATQTALRYGNWNFENYRVVQAPEGGLNLQLKQVKTINPLEIPLSEIALGVLDRNGGAMPKKISPASTINHLDVICSAAGIKKDITTHTGRRTFCTTQEAEGVPRHIIMRISGHKTEREYLKYLGISFEYNATMMRRANPEMFAKVAG